MNLQIKKIILLLLSVIFIAGINNVRAQIDDSHFIYIQSENRKPFYVVLNEKLYSSSSIGYLIIPKLKSGTYNFRLGFPQNAGPEQKFSTVVKNIDIGYSLKAVDKDTYSLTDLQTQEVIVANGKSAPAEPKEEVTASVPPPKKREEQPAVTQPEPEKVAAPVEGKPEEAVAVNEAPAKEEPKSRTFGDLMSTVVNDPNLAKPVEKENPRPQRDPFEETKIVRSDGEINATDTAPEAFVENVAAPPSTTVASSAPSDTYGVIRTEDKKVDNGREMSFVLLSNTSTDSVKIFIPSDEPQPVTQLSESSIVPSSVQQSAEDKRKRSIAYFDYEDLAKQSPPAFESKSNRKDKRSERFIKKEEQSSAQPNQVSNPFYANEQKELPAAAETIVESTEITEPATSYADYSNCTGGEIADRDFNKMRNKMIGRDNDDDMVATAMDMLGKKCISTSKVKTLGGLFITDNGRLRFFKTIYGQVSDKQNFSSLESLIYDRAKKTEFRNLVK